MTPQDLIAAFETVADAPEGVKRLRELVLQLAVLGKLVPQDASDAESGVIVESDSPGRRRGKRPVSAGGVEPPFNVPNGWRWQSLGEITHEWGSKEPDRPFTYIDVGSIDNRRGVIGDELAVLEAEAAPSRARKLVQRGSVIYSTVRPYLLNIAVVDRDFQPEPIVSTAFAVLHPGLGLDCRYLYLVVRSGYFIDYVSAAMKGVAYPAINDAQLMAAPVPVPPLPEQRRIAARVDELMVLLDRLDAARNARDEVRRAARDAALAALRDAEDADAIDLAWSRLARNMDDLFAYPDDVPPLRQAVLELAVTGRLAKQASDEWARVLLSEVVEAFQNGTASRGGEGGPPVVVLRLADIKHGRIVTTSFRQIDLSTVSAKKYAVQAGDLLAIRVNGSGDLVGRMILVEQSENWCYCDHLIRIRLQPTTLVPRFLSAYADTQRARDHLGAVTVTTAGQKTVNQRGLGSLRVPMPPIAEQERIISKVDALTAMCDSLQARLDSAAETHAQFAAAAVHHANV